MPACKITVLKRIVHKDLVEEYMEPGAVTRPCPHFIEGQEFIVDEHPGEDFCDAAWNDIYKAYLTLMGGGDFSPWMKEENTFIACCSDGVRRSFSSWRESKISEGLPCQSQNSRSRY